MKIHLNQIPAEGLHREGEDPPQVLDLRDPSIRPLSGIRYALDIGLSDGGLFATGEIGIDLELQCVSCLEKFSFPLEVPEFACQVELTGSETVDLTEPMREDIFLALPPHPHCDWNGERACPGVFPRMQTETLGASDAEIREVWGALDQLKIKKIN